MTGLQEIRNLHADCGCLLRTADANLDQSVKMSHDGCRLVILGLRLVIACDRCSAFESDETRPDLLILRRVSDGYEWLIVEIKSIMDSDAAPQVQAGIDKIAMSPMFSPLRAAKSSGLFASKKANRTANVDALRHSLKAQGRPVPARVERCGNNRRL